MKEIKIIKRYSNNISLKKLLKEYTKNKQI